MGKKCGIIGDMMLLNKNDHLEFTKIINYLIEKNYTLCIDDKEIYNLKLSEKNLIKLSGSNFKKLDVILFLSGDVNLLNKFYNILILNLDIKLYLFNYKYWRSLEGWFEFNNIKFIKNEYFIIESLDSFKANFEVNKFENKLTSLMNNSLDVIQEEIEESSLEAD